MRRRIKLFPRETVINLFQSPFYMLSLIGVATYLVMGYLGGRTVPAFVFNAVDEGFKVVTALIIALCVSSRWKRVMLICVAVAIFVLLPYSWYVQTFVAIYITQTYFLEWPGYWAVALYEATIHFLVCVSVGLALAGWMRVHLWQSRDDEYLPFQKFSLRTLFGVVTAISALFCLAQFTHLVKAFSASPSRAYIVYGADAMRLSITAWCCMMIVFGMPITMGGVLAGGIASAGLCCLIPYAFNLSASMSVWAGYSLLQYFVMITALCAVRRSGYRLTKQDAG